MPTAVLPLRPLQCLRTGPCCSRPRLSAQLQRPSPACRWFRASAPHRIADFARRNHYQRLEIQHDATAADIKKSFYRLSKTHHPDANRDDPNASQTFSLLSESYTILSNPSRRATYDRDVLRLHEKRHQHDGPQPRGSYSSTQAGGRSPSGLSRRRTTFRGPPPSFYRSGGWGEQADKRRRAHEESTGGGGGGGSNRSSSTYEEWRQQQERQQASRERAYRQAGMGPGSDPFGHADDVYHFDKEGHRRTQGRQDTLREKRRRATNSDDVEFEDQTSLGTHFAIVSGILLTALMAPVMYLHYASPARKRRDKL